MFQVPVRHPRRLLLGMSVRLADLQPHLVSPADLSSKSAPEVSHNFSGFFPGFKGSKPNDEYAYCIPNPVRNLSTPR